MYNNRTDDTLNLMRRKRSKTVSLTIPKGRGIRNAIAGASMMPDYQILCTGSLEYDIPTIGIRDLSYMIADVQYSIDVEGVCCKCDLGIDYMCDEFNQVFGMGVVMTHPFIKRYDKISIGVLCNCHSVIVSKRMSDGVYRAMVITENTARWVDNPVKWNNFPWQDIVESEIFREIFSEPTDYSHNTCYN